MKVVNGKVGTYNLKMEISNRGKDLYMTVRAKLYLQYETDIKGNNLYCTSSIKLFKKSE